MSSFRDKVRDELYGGEADELKNESEAADVADLVDSLERPTLAPKSLILSLVAEGFVLGLIITFPFNVENFANRSPAVAILAPFVLGAMIGFAACAMATEKAPREPTIEYGVMSGYSTEEHELRSMRRWYVAAAAGVINIIAIYAFLHLWAG